MDLKVNKEKFLSILEKINQLNHTAVLYSKNGLFIQSRFTDSGEVLNLKLSPNNFDIDVFGVNSVSLCNIIKSIQGDEIELVIGKNNLKISDSEKEYKINISKDVYAPDFNLKISESLSINLDILLQYIPYFFNMRDKNYMPYDAIFLKENLMIATDSRRLYKVRLPDTVKFIPQLAIDNLRGFFTGEVNYCINESLFVVFKEDEYYAVRLLESKLPDYQPLFNGFTQKQIKVKKDFLTPIKNALLVYESKNMANVILTIKNKDILIEAASDEIGSLKEKYTGIFGEGEIKIGMNCGYLKDAIEFISKFHDEFIIQYQESHKALYLHSNTFDIEILLMPIRITGEEKDAD